MDLIKTIQELEPIFFQSGQLAYEMQKNVKHHSKFNTGNSEVDIVTEADIAVQEFLLKEFAKTELINCHLLAEEKTPMADKFNKQGKYYLALDPIDGTATYAKGGKFFCVIVSLHDGKVPLYTFVYYPVLNWTHKIVNNNYSVSGEIPSFNLPSDIGKTIVYDFGNPEKNIPELYQELKSNGINFTKVQTIDRDMWTIPMFLCNKVAGIYREDVNVYDSLVEFHFALAKGYKVYSGGPNGSFDLSNIKEREYGLYYPGYYLALQS